MPSRILVPIATPRPTPHNPTRTTTPRPVPFAGLAAGERRAGGAGALGRAGDREEGLGPGRAKCLGPVTGGEGWVIDEFGPWVGRCWVGWMRVGGRNLEEVWVGGFRWEFWIGPC